MFYGGVAAAAVLGVRAACKSCVQGWEALKDADADAVVAVGDVYLLAGGRVQLCWACGCCMQVLCYTGGRLFVVCLLMRAFKRLHVFMKLITFTTHTHTHFHTFKHTHTHTHIHCHNLHVFMELIRSTTHTHTQTHTLFHTFRHTHTHTFKHTHTHSLAQFARFHGADHIHHTPSHTQTHIHCHNRHIAYPIHIACCVISSSCSLPHSTNAFTATIAQCKAHVGLFRHNQVRTNGLSHFSCVWRV